MSINIPENSNSKNINQLNSLFADNINNQNSSFIFNTQLIDQQRLLNLQNKSNGNQNNSNKGNLSHSLLINNQTLLNSRIELRCEDHISIFNEIKQATRYCKYCKKILCDSCTIEYHNSHIKEAKLRIEETIFNNKRELDDLENKLISSKKNKNFSDLSNEVTKYILVIDSFFSDRKIKINEIVMKLENIVKNDFELYEKLKEKISLFVNELMVKRIELFNKENEIIFSKLEKLTNEWNSSSCMDKINLIKSENLTMLKNGYEVNTINLNKLYEISKVKITNMMNQIDGMMSKLNYNEKIGEFNMYISTMNMKICEITQKLLTNKIVDKSSKKEIESIDIKDGENKPSDNNIVNIQDKSKSLKGNLNDRKSLEINQDSLEIPQNNNKNNILNNNLNHQINSLQGNNYSLNSIPNMNVNNPLLMKNIINKNMQIFKNNIISNQLNQSLPLMNNNLCLNNMINPNNINQMNSISLNPNINLMSVMNQNTMMNKLNIVSLNSINKTNNMNNINMVNSNLYNNINNNILHSLLQSSNPEPIVKPLSNKDKLPKSIFIYEYILSINQKKNEIISYSPESGFTAIPLDPSLFSNPNTIFSVFPLHSKYVNLGSSLLLTGGYKEKKLISSCFKIKIDKKSKDKKCIIYPYKKMNHARERHNIVFLPDRKIVFVCSGFDELTSEYTDLNSESWIEVGKLNEFRGNGTICYVNSKYVFIFGGYKMIEKKGIYVGNCEYFDMDNMDKGWKFINLDEKYNLKLSAMGVVYLNNSCNNILLCGGYDGITYKNEIWNVNLKDSDYPKISLNNNVLEGRYIFMQNNFVNIGNCGYNFEFFNSVIKFDYESHEFEELHYD